VSGEPTLPTAIGRYKPLGVLGSGAMGTVYKARDPAIGRVVAVKVIRTDALEADMREEYVERFKREVQAAGRCSHAAIVGVYDFSGSDANPYIVMEYVEGMPLNQLLRDPARDTAVGSRPGALVISVVTQVLEGLGYAHRLGITHRDVKPANILVTTEGRAKIVDFGIARLTELGLTQAGAMLGTPSYMSPEQVTEADVDYRADLFAVGAILYEAIGGRPPFVGRNLSDTILRLSRPDPAPMEPILAAGGERFVAVLQRALAKPRDQRFQSAEEFAASLASARLPPAPAAAEVNDTMAIGPGDVMPRFPPPAPPEPGSLGGSLADGRWDPALLRRIERALATHVGPMARVMLRDAARRSTTADELVQTLSQLLGNPSDRTQFLRATSADRPAPTLIGPTPTPPTSVGATALGRTGPVPAPASFTQTGLASPGPVAIGAPAVEAAQAALVVYVGPMARVLARKAAAEATSARDFIERLCAHVPAPKDNTAFRRKLQAQVEPKLR
jgi:serine/threonine-protein kinase